MLKRFLLAAIVGCGLSVLLQAQSIFPPSGGLNVSACTNGWVLYKSSGDPCDLSVTHDATTLVTVLKSKQTPLSGAGITPTLTGAGAGSVTNGVHRFAFTVVTDAGETTIGAVTNAVTVTDNTTDGQVSLAVPAVTVDNGNSAVYPIAVNVYATKAGGSTYYLTDLAPDIYSATSTWNQADGALTVVAPSTNTAIETLLSFDADGILTLPYGSYNPPGATLQFSNVHDTILRPQARVTSGRRLVLNGGPSDGSGGALALAAGAGYGGGGGSTFIDGGTGLTSGAVFIGAISTSSVNVTPTLSTNDIAVSSGKALKTDTTTAHTALFQAYDVDGTAYKTFGTLTNGNTPDFTIAPPSGGTVAVTTNTGLFDTSTPTSITSTSANSCGTTSPTLNTGSSNSRGSFNVGATSGTNCTLTFSQAAAHAWVCNPTDETSNVLIRAVSATTTTTTFQGVMTAADVIGYNCNAF